MITQLRIENFFSIKDKVVIDFTKIGTSPKESAGYKTYRETASSRHNVSLVNGFFGANASGKTTTLKAISAVLYHMLDTDKDELNTGVYPNIYNRDVPTKLGIDISLDKYVYSYNLELNGAYILSEELKVAIIKNKLSFKKVFTKKKGEKIWINKSFKEFSNLNVEDVEIQLGQSETVLPQLITRKITLLKELLIFKRNHYTNVRWVNDQSSMGSELYNIIAAIHDDKEALSVTTELVKAFNPSMESISIEHDTNSSKMAIKSIYKNYQELDINFESSGTKELMKYGYTIIRCLKNGGIFIFDEINRYLHPDIVYEIVNLFLDPEINRNGAQLFFSSHEHEIMNSLTLDQIHLTEKEDMSTEVYKLSESGAESRDNIQKKYRVGQYGATPDIMEFRSKLASLI